MAKFDLKHGEINRILNSDRLGADLMRRMAPTLPAAQSSAPVVTGAYRNSLKLILVHTDRVVVRLISDSPYAMSVEASTGNLARALSQAGGV